MAPFQVTFSVSSKAGVINSFTAGEDIFTICELDATLSASVDGNLAGHTVLWEQISGSQVTWTTDQNQLTVSYTTTIADDKVFRFWIDKGFSDEQFDDLTAFATPTSDAIVSEIPSKRSNHSVNFAFTGNIQGLDADCRTPKVSLLRGFDPTGEADCVYDKNDQNKYTAILWNKPCSFENVQQFIVQERPANGSWSNVATLSKDSPRYFTNLNEGSAYRIVTPVIDARAGHFQTREIISNQVYVDPNPDAERSPRVFLSSPAKPASVSNSVKSVNLLSYDVFIPTKITKTAGTDFPEDKAYVGDISASTDHINVPTYTVLSGASIGG